MSTNREVSNSLNIIKNAIIEDLGKDGDITSIATINSNQMTDFIISNREDCVLCGSDIIELTFKQLDSSIKISKNFNDGDFITAGEILATQGINAEIINIQCKMHINFRKNYVEFAATSLWYSN